MKPIIIGVAGGTGSGKTTVVKTLVGEIGPDRVLLIQHDSYYRDRSHLPYPERTRLNYDHPESLETSLLVQHLTSLQNGSAVEIPIYDFASHCRLNETKPTGPKPVIVIDGILVLSESELRNLMDLRLFVDTDGDTRFIRRLTRDVEERGRTVDSVIHQYLSTVKPMHEQFVEPSKRFADLIVPEGGSNRIAIEVLLAKIRSLLDGTSTLSRRVDFAHY